jgi:hypothetical protein
VKIKPYRYPDNQKEQIEKMVLEMLQQGIIQPNTSLFSSPIVLVKKKDGTSKFCTDYWVLNAIIEKDSFPVLTVNELIDELFGAKKYILSLVLKKASLILMQPTNRHKTEFKSKTHQSHYEWLIMPFGLTNAPATFQSLINQNFQSYY